MRNQSTIRIIFFVLAMATYLAVPAYMILEYEWRLDQGETYRFRTRPKDPFNPFTGRSMVLGFDQRRLSKHEDSEDLWKGESIYILIDVDEEGFAYFSDYTKTIPEDRAYMKSELIHISKNHIKFDIPFDRYYLNEAMAPKAESLYRKMSREDRDAVYVEVKILEGETILQDLYIEHTPIIEFMESRAQD
ncbi:MAG: GDYXXLXY domain-containing protein [Bacteroidota bacterium]